MGQRGRGAIESEALFVTCCGRWPCKRLSEMQAGQPETQPCAGTMQQHKGLGWCEREQAHRDFFNHVSHLPVGRHRVGQAGVRVNSSWRVIAQRASLGLRLPTVGGATGGASGAALRQAGGGASSHWSGRYGSAAGSN